MRFFITSSFLSISKNGEVTHVTEWLVEILPLVDILCNCIVSERDAQDAFPAQSSADTEEVREVFGVQSESWLQWENELGVGEITD